MRANEFINGTKKFNQRNLELWEKKNQEYADSSDIFRNFAEAAKWTIGNRKRHVAAWNFAVKHLISVADIVKNDEKFSDEQIQEKFGDLIIYLQMIFAMITEKRRGND